MLGGSQGVLGSPRGLSGVLRIPTDPHEFPNVLRRSQTTTVIESSEVNLSLFFGVLRDSMKSLRKSNGFLGIPNGSEGFPRYA